MDKKLDILFDFLIAIENDSRVTTAHISLFVMLWRRWAAGDRGLPLIFFKREIMPLCRISSRSTYHKIIGQLHKYGYIRYAPSFNHFEGSRVEFFETRKM